MIVWCLRTPPARVCTCSSGGGDPAGIGGGETGLLDMIKEFCKEERPVFELVVDEKF